MATPTAPTTYNNAYDIAFEVAGAKDPKGDTTTADEIRAALQKRLNDLDDDELMEAVGMPYDSYVVGSILTDVLESFND